LVERDLLLRGFLLLGKRGALFLCQSPHAQLIEQRLNWSGCPAATFSRDSGRPISTPTTLMSYLLKRSLSSSVARFWISSRFVNRSSMCDVCATSRKYAVRIGSSVCVISRFALDSGQTEAHHYDEDLTSIDRECTADGYGVPLSSSFPHRVPESAVGACSGSRREAADHANARSDSHRRTSATSRRRRTCLILLTKREEIQKRATEELSERFQEI